jgi:hypothetical protein
MLTIFLLWMKENFTSYDKVKNLSHKAAKSPDHGVPKIKLPRLLSRGIKIYKL